MHTPLFALTADWHVARSAWKHRGIDGDSYHALLQVVDRCIDLGVPLVAAGDLFDTTDPHPDDVGFVRRQLDRMKAAGLHVYYIQGQHERESTPWLDGIHRWPTHVDDVTFDLGGLALHGLDWRPAGRLAAGLAAIPAGVDAVVCHQVWKNLMGGQAACEGDLRDVPHARLVLTGDFHKHIRLDLERDDGTPLTVLSPGSLCMQSIDEEPVKHFFVVGRDDDGDLAVEGVPLHGRMAATYEVGSGSELESVLFEQFPYLDRVTAEYAATGKIPAALARPLVRVRLGAAVADARARIKAAARGYHLFLDQPARSATDGGDALAAEDRRRVLESLRARGVLGVLESFPLDGVDDPDAVRAGVASLLAAGDPEAVLEELCRA